MMITKIIRILVQTSASWKVKRFEAVVTATAIVAITFYQYFISRLLRRHCLFQPSCSQYAKEMMQAHGWNDGMPRFLKQYDDCCGTYDVRFFSTGIVLIGKSGYRVSCSSCKQKYFYTAKHGPTKITSTAERLTQHVTHTLDCYGVVSLRQRLRMAHQTSRRRSAGHEQAQRTPHRSLSK